MIFVKIPPAFRDTWLNFSLLTNKRIWIFSCFYKNLHFSKTLEQAFLTHNKNINFVLTDSFSLGMIMILPWWMNSANSIRQTSMKILSWSLERKITWQKDQSNLFHLPKKRTQNSFFRGCWKCILCHEQSCGQIWRFPLMICLLEWPCQK